MPIYEYACPKCGHQLEKYQGYDDPNPKCEKCLEKEKKEVEMQKQISLPSFQLKGGGWAKDGYSG